MVISHPLTITGSAGTILEIVNGNVVCDFRAFIKSRPASEDRSKWKACISEISLIFKLDSNKIFERLKDISQKLNFGNQKVSYSETCLKYFKVNRNIITLPLIVTEDQSSLEVRDCYLRSMKKDTTRLNPDNISNNIN